ncbi:tetratricopeptide repeat protein [Rhabdochromatium marinum]|uniref:tetratricopeptide repeat protein n=1 Tax=Rhabdochromatium marinum TaxID=48729 RepID=UPI0019086DBD|nr:hypothetical protein [Rhabdochromatium marinum]
MNASANPNPVEQTGDAFSALRRAIVRSRSFSLQLCTCDSPLTRDRLIESLAASLPGLTIHCIELPDPAEQKPLEAVAALAPPGPVMIVGLETLLADEDRAERFLSALNLSRGDWPLRVSAPIVVWLPRRLLGRLTAGAPDFFDWRSDILDFPELTTDQMRPFATRDWEWGIDPRLTREEQDERLRELEARLASTRDTHDEPVCRRRLEWWDELADFKWVRGALDEALRIRTEEELPVYERLGDVREKAETQGKIADILEARGQLEEALRIRTEEQLPVYERLGDVREKAVTQGKIADILQARGQIEEALRIRTEEQLPVYERLGDVRAKAVTRGKIADILQARGQLEEALRIRTEEELPVYERLGDVREKAVTQGQIADILQARGQLEEALRIRTEKALPVFERLGDVRSLLVCRAMIALNLLARDAAEDRAPANALLCLALADAHRLGIPEAAQIERILQRYGMCSAMGSWIPPHGVIA